jgi:fermentation-respiration switch protein FrsA (DUF1100 family)
MSHRVLTFLSVIVVPYLAVVAAAWLFQRHLIYLPMHDVPAPAAVGLAQAESVTLRTADRLELGAWLIPPGEPPTGFTIVVFNGNGGHRAYRAPLGIALARRGIRTLLFDYRGYGGNRGSPHEDGLALDARAAVDYLLGRPDVDPERIVYFGESLGGAVAARLAADRPPRALILRSPFASLAAVARHHYPFLPVRWLLRETHDTAGHVARVTCPTLVITSDLDSIVPAAETRAAFDAARGPKRLLTIKGADHNDFELIAGDELLDAIVGFLSMR